VQIHRVDQKPALEVIEGYVTNQMVDQGLERFAAIQGGSEEPAECYVCPGNLKDIPPSHQAGPSLHLTEGDAGGPRGSDQGSDAGAYYQAGYQAPLLQRAKHPDVREALETTAAEDQSEGAIGNHWLPGPRVESELTTAQPMCKNRAPRLDTAQPAKADSGSSDAA
jgi:hypothetical protein